MKLCITFMSKLAQCIYIYIHTHTNTCIDMKWLITSTKYRIQNQYICIHTHTNTQTHATTWNIDHLHVEAAVSKYNTHSIRILTHTNTRIYDIYIYIYIYIHIYIYMYIYMYICKYIYMRTALSATRPAARRLLDCAPLAQAAGAMCTYIYVYA